MMTIFSDIVCVFCDRKFPDIQRRRFWVIAVTPHSFIWQLLNVRRFENGTFSCKIGLGIGCTALAIFIPSHETKLINLHKVGAPTWVPWVFPGKSKLPEYKKILCTTSLFLIPKVLMFLIPNFRFQSPGTVAKKTKTTQNGNEAIA